ncbi:hypothetical protein JKF63_04767 [Porcisia hertigi]|uniref:Uncharacterized protein n=1 Tax=Porcisia hertigi TaxID=2761500 RepID=A0A836LBR4_9TRYP|nr:hypothetical protein JKF63_04767 [Porcisia hertigi]
MLRCMSRCLLFEFKDLKSKTILEKLRNQKLKSGVHPMDVDMAELAREGGITPSNHVNLHDFVREKEAVIGMLQDQRLRRIARREAFLEWQAGQREKGAAHRLVRQSRKAEKYKRRHYHATSGRMLPLALSCGETAPEGPAQKSAPQLCVSYTEFLRGSSSQSFHAIHLSLRKK